MNYKKKLYHDSSQYFFQENQCIYCWNLLHDPLQSFKRNNNNCRRSMSCHPNARNTKIVTGSSSSKITLLSSFHPINFVRFLVTAITSFPLHSCSNQGSTSLLAVILITFIKIIYKYNYRLQTLYTWRSVQNRVIQTCQIIIDHKSSTTIITNNIQFVYIYIYISPPFF